MKVAVIFYSFSGNTKRVCEFLHKNLAALGNAVDMIQLTPLKEVTNFLKQCFHARRKKIPELIETDYNVGEYDLIIYASPVWAFTFAPALRSYLDKVNGLENKKVACFFTCGSPATSGKALEEIEDILRCKKARILVSKYLLGNKVKDDAYLQQMCSPLFEMTA